MKQPCQTTKQSRQASCKHYVCYIHILKKQSPVYAQGSKARALRACWGRKPKPKPNQQKKRENSRAMAYPAALCVRQEEKPGGEIMRLMLGHKQERAKHQPKLEALQNSSSDNNNNIGVRRKHHHRWYDLNPRLGEKGEAKRGAQKNTNWLSQGAPWPCI